MKGRSSPDQALRRAGAMGLRPFCRGAGQRGRRQASSIRHQAWAGGRTLLHQPLMFGGLAAGPVGGCCRTGVIILPPWGRSSAGRARRSQCRGREFDPPRLHHPHSTPDPSKGWAFFVCVAGATIRKFRIVAPGDAWRHVPASGDGQGRGDGCVGLVAVQVLGLDCDYRIRVQELEKLRGIDAVR